MKDSEFLEILNLYLDHEISAADSLRLEAEVTGNPERRRIYREYCRLHKACLLLGDQIPATAPAWRGKSGAILPRRPAWGVGIYAGGMLAAACVAMLVVTRMHPAAAGTPVTPARSASFAASPVAIAAPTPSDHREFQPVFTARPVARWESPAIPSPEFNDQFAWMNRVQLAPIQGTLIDTAMFEPAPILLDTDNRAIHPAPSSQAPMERASFQFQR